MEPAIIMPLPILEKVPSTQPQHSTWQHENPVIPTSAAAVCKLTVDRMTP